MVEKIDLELIRNAQLGDHDALAKLLSICNVDIRKYAYKHCHVNDIEDASQETLLKVTKNLPALRSIEAFSSWMFTIVKRECHRALKKYHMLQLENGEDSIATLRDPEVRILLTKALDSLPPHFLQVIIFCDFLEMSITEIAAEINETPASVKSRIHRARVLIREYLKS